MNIIEIIEALEKVSEYCENTLCSECNFCNKATGECAFSLAFTVPNIWNECYTFLAPSDWDLKELRNNE